MPKSRKKRKSPKRVLALPDLEQAKSAVLNTLTSKSGQRTYDHAITEFVEWYCSEPRLAFNRTVVLRISQTPDYLARFVQFVLIWGRRRSEHLSRLSLMTTTKGSWQTEEKRLVCRWFENGESCRDNPPWDKDALANVHQTDVSTDLPTPVLELRRFSPFGGKWYLPNRLR